MRISNLELKKTILMIVLLLLSVYQMGILWSEKNPGVPFPFSPRMRNRGTVDIHDVKGNYYRPQTIMISDGMGLYWPLDSKNNLHRSIWKDFHESYFSQILSLRPIIGEKPYERDWDTLSKMKCIIFEFKNPIPIGVIRWMVNADVNVSPAVRQIYKIAVFPSEDINHNKNTLYVYDNQTVYKYVVTVEQGSMKKEDYEKAINADRSNEPLIPMNRLISVYSNLTENSDILFTFSDNKKKIWDLLVKTPDEIVLKRDNIESVQEHLMEEYKGSMVTKLSDDGTNILFSDTEQVYRYYHNGFLDYQYRNKDGEKGLVEEALEKALTFIEYRKKNLVQGAGIYLSDIDQESSDRYYTFTFNYVVDDMEIKIVKDRQNNLQPAIVITANRDRVLDAKWYIKTFTYNDYSNLYSLLFVNFYEKQFIREFPELEGAKIEHISIEYLLSEHGMRAEPYWLVETDSKMVYLRMVGKGE